MGTISEASLSPTGGFGYDRRAVLPFMPLKAQVQNNASQSVPHATWTKISLQTINYDTNGNFDTTLFRYTAYVFGYYKLSGTISWATRAINARYAATIYVNGVELPVTRASQLATYADILNVTTAATNCFLNKGDYVELWGYQSSGIAMNALNSGAEICSFTAHFFSQ